jgi:hypothetical protein
MATESSIKVLLVPETLLLLLLFNHRTQRYSNAIEYKRASESAHTAYDGIEYAQNELYITLIHNE